MEEHIFLNEEEVRVTSTRLIIDGETYVIGAITSIKNGRKEKNVPILTLTIGGILILLGLFLKVAIGGLIMSGVIFLIIAAIIWFFQKETHNVIVGFSSGEHKVISDTNKDLIEKVVRALNNSIVFRG